jgi:hypothetical protein
MQLPGWICYLQLSESSIPRALFSVDYIQASPVYTCPYIITRFHSFYDCKSANLQQMFGQYSSHLSLRGRHLTSYVVVTYVHSNEQEVTRFFREWKSII